MDNKTDTQANTQANTQAKAGAMIVPVTLFEQNCTIIWHEPSKKAIPAGTCRGFSKQSSRPASPSRRSG
jgi:hypothetical protein